MKKIEMYQSEDGGIFPTKESCLAYEKGQQKEKCFFNIKANISINLNNLSFCLELPEDAADDDIIEAIYKYSIDDLLEFAEDNYGTDWSFDVNNISIE